MSTPTILNYQGNKSSLIPFLKKNLQKHLQPGDIFFDIFSGSGSVGAAFKNENIVFANDAEVYASMISSALLNTPNSDILRVVSKQFTDIVNNNIKKNINKFETQVNKEREFIQTDSNADLIILYNNFPTIWNGFDGISVESYENKKSIIYLLIITQDLILESNSLSLSTLL